MFVRRAYFVWACLAAGAVRSALGAGAARGAATTYTGAVVEFASLRVNSTMLPADAKVSHMLGNVAAFAPFVQKAKAGGAQIIVFPEYAITGAGTTDASGMDPLKRHPFDRDDAEGFCESVPQPHANLTLCTQAAARDHPVVQALACLAKSHGIVLVANLLERENCATTTNTKASHFAEDASPCRGGRRQFNTAIAFDESGSLVAKYHKRHLYGHEKKSLDRGRDRQPNSSFMSSFGVRFGMFVCYDILFEQVLPFDVHDYVYPTEWVNWIHGDFPLERSTSVQKRWSFNHEKNLLAANYGGLGFKASGSGIWSHGEKLAEYFNPSRQPKSRLLLAEINTHRNM